MVGFTVLAIAVLGSFVLIFALRKSSARNLNDWLKRNQFILLSQESGSFKESPFSYLSISRDNSFYRITVQTEAGVTKTGWVRVSGKFAALLASPVEVIWDK